ncbi:MAG: molecular chaperone TorD family protein [Bacteroidales bacterium]|nr:molecular chaperone TorD family protein [Bacteroidales bacterium]
MTEGWHEIDDNFFAAYTMMLSFAGSFILFEPQTGCISDLIEMDLLKQLPVDSDNPNFIKAASYLRKIDPEHPLDYDKIINDHLELFGGKGKALAPPYSSVYMSPDHIINDTVSIRVRKLYHAYGWKSQMEGKVPDDHLGIELQFINLLLSKYPELEDNVCRNEIRKDLIKFIDAYINPWINEWNRYVQENAESDFYKGIAYLTLSGIEDIYSTLSRQNGDFFLS